MQTRCKWASSEIEINYHDQEWGKPLHDDQKLFESLILELNQAGLSWATILNKRQNFRFAYDNFDYHKIAEYDDKKILELLNNSGVIRNKLKIVAAISNAQAFIKIQKTYQSFDKFIWSYVKNKPIVNEIKNENNMCSYNELSIKISNDLKKFGFKFLGKTTVYAFLQAIGVINDHWIYCEFK